MMRTLKKGGHITLNYTQYFGDKGGDKNLYLEHQMKREKNGQGVEVETFITILKLQIHTFDKQKQFYEKIDSNKLIEQPT